MFHTLDEMHVRLEAERTEGADPEDTDEYRAANIFWVPPEARWTHLKAQSDGCVPDLLAPDE